jgi:hypothetical protein
MSPAGRRNTLWSMVLLQVATHDPALASTERDEPVIQIKPRVAGPGGTAIRPGRGGRFDTPILRGDRH